MTYKLLIGENLYKFNTMKLKFKRKNKKEWAGGKGREGRRLIFIRIDIENDSKWNYIKFLITFDEKILDP